MTTKVNILQNFITKKNKKKLEINHIIDAPFITNILKMRTVLQGISITTLLLGYFSVRTSWSAHSGSGYQ